jgi:hypothetical protein
MKRIKQRQSTVDLLWDGTLTAEFKRDEAVIHRS